MHTVKKIKLVFNFRQPDKGFAAFFLAILVLATMLAIGVSLTILIVGEQKISRNIVKSSQAYYTSEAGIEDAIYRLSKNKQWTNSYDLDCGGGIASVTISEIIGGSRTITSQGDISNRIRKVQIVYSVSSQQVSFHYGAQVGDGGIQMQDAAKIEGNVFSNGSAIGTSKQTITGSIIVATNGNKIENLDIGGNAKAYSCQDCSIGGTLTYVFGGQVTNCGDSIQEQLDEIEPRDLPISQAQITSWKNDASSAEPIVCAETPEECTISGKEKVSLGPKKIEGNLTIQDQGELSLTGTIWVTGNVTVQDKGKLYLQQSVYGSNSGMIIADGQITAQDTASVKGSGLIGSYLMLLSTHDSTISGQDAIILLNSPELDIIYASKGFILLQDSIKLREVSSWGLKLQNTAKVIYETGLADVSFSSGPGGSWEVISWREIE